MSHRITIEQAQQMHQKEQENKQLMKSGKTVKSRRQKKYATSRKRQDGILWRMKDRIRKTHGTMPKHLKETKT